MSSTLDKLEKISSFYEELLASDLSLLSDDVKGTLREKKERLRKQVAEARVKSELIRNDSYPLTVAIVGSFKTGKSTVLNSLLGDEIVGMDVPPATAKVTTIKHGDEIGFFGIDKDDQRVNISHQDYIRLSTHSYDSNMKKRARTQDQDYKRFEVEYPLESLRKLDIMDTPGFSSESTDDDEVTKVAVKDADVFLWVFDANRGSASKEELDLLKDLTDKCSDNTRICGIINRIDEKPTQERPRVIEGFKKSLIGRIDHIIDYSGKEVLDMKKQSKIWENTLAELMDSMRKQCIEGLSVQATVSPTSISAHVSVKNKATLHQIGWIRLPTFPHQISNRTIFKRKLTGMGRQDDYGFKNLSGVLEDWRKHSADITKNLLLKSSAESLEEEKKYLSEKLIQLMKTDLDELNRSLSEMKKSVDFSAKKLREKIDSLGEELKEKLVTELQDKIYNEKVRHLLQAGYRIRVDMEGIDKIIKTHFQKFTQKTISAAKTLDSLFEGSDWRNGLDAEIMFYKEVFGGTSGDSLISLMYVFDNWTEVPESRINELEGIPLCLDSCIADEILTELTKMLLKQRIERVVEDRESLARNTIRISGELISKAEAILNAC